jgi:hypothetical protein
MAMDNPINTFTGKYLVPAVNPHLAKEQSVNFAPNQVIARGTALAQATASVNDVQTVSISGTPTGGTFTLTFALPGGQSQTTAAIAYNATAANVQSALQALTNIGSGNVTCTGGALPGAGVVCTFGGSLGNMPVPLMTANGAALTGGTSPAASVAHTTQGSTLDTYSAYTSQTGTAAALAKYDVATDANGMVTYGSVANGGPWGETYLAAPVYTSGEFYTSDLTGVTSGFVTLANGRFTSGNITAGGIFKLP